MEEKEHFNYDVDSDLKLDDETQENTNQDKKESSEELFQNDKDKSQKLVSRITKYKNEHKIKFYVIISLMLLTLIAILSFAIPVSINNLRKRLYNDLIYEMQYFDDNSISQIDSIISRLPEDYRDLKTIKSEYKDIKRYANILIENNFTSSFMYEEGSSDKAREAYKQLKTYSSIYLDWNLEDFLDSIEIGVLIFDVEWINSSGSYRFKWTYNENIDDERLRSNIPNDKESEKEYYFTTEIRDDYVIFGYKNKDNENDKFDAFRVSNIRYTNSKYYIDVYCFKNDTREIFTFI